MKVLILRFSSIGDIVLTTPVIRCLKTQLDNIQLHYCIKKEYAPLLRENPYIDKLHFLESSIWKLIPELRAEKFDIIIDLHHNLRTRIIKTNLGVRSVSYNKLNIEKWMLVNLRINKLPNIHIVDRYMKTVEELGVVNDEKGLDHFIPASDEIDEEWLPEPFRKEYVALVVGAQHGTKKLPLNRLIELCDKINKPVVVIGGKEDIEVGLAIEAFFSRGKPEGEMEAGLIALNKKTLVFNACGKFSINQSASLVKNSIAVFTHDTGLMHIAAAFKKNIFSIWGNTVPAFGMYPYKTKFTILENTRLNCRPCSKIGHNSCPKGHFKCMNDIIFDFYLP